jgi:hypothetical protein
MSSISGEKSTPVISAFGNTFCMANAKSPVPVARSTMLLGFQAATIWAACFRQ